MKAKKNKNNLEECPVSNTLKIIGGKWRLRIINEIGEDKRRFGELKRLIPEISEKMLIQELKALVEYQIIVRKAYKEIPPRVEYYASEKGKKVFPIIEEIKKFSNDTN
ncbi:winged helix-turn-helix transcriptional regulator [Aquimarina spongiae]|uniref:Transcriptional regulator, HxlR family n=1 Tax=Aquimarina spongiae TaxID=570521 RepID=A0A1M6G9Z1_9FLAO|nr:helix-turn-helix domain-containing protein [Aquimarina spongiae]SHJ06763.1 transcriptional regulator, HxlR family [Aquimarina spongiae]